MQFNQNFFWANDKKFKDSKIFQTSFFFFNKSVIRSTPVEHTNLDSRKQVFIFLFFDRAAFLPYSQNRISNFLISIFPTLFYRNSSPIKRPRSSLLNKQSIGGVQWDWIDWNPRSRTIKSAPAKSLSNVSNRSWVN